MPEFDEPILPDDYPIYADYLYVADGKVIRSDTMASPLQTSSAASASQNYAAVTSQGGELNALRPLLET